MAVTSKRWLVRLTFVLFGALLGLTVLGCERKLGTETGPVSAASQPAARQPTAKMDGTKMYKKPSDAELRQQLSPLEYEVTQRDATEPPFNNRFWDNHA